MDNAPLTWWFKPFLNLYLFLSGDTRINFLLLSSKLCEDQADTLHHPRANKKGLKA